VHPAEFFVKSAIDAASKVEWLSRRMVSSRSRLAGGCYVFAAPDNYVGVCAFYSLFFRAFSCFRVVSSSFFLALLLWSTQSAGGQLQAIEEPGFPRILGMNIGAKNYDEPAYRRMLALPDVVVLGFYPDWVGKDSRWSIRTLVRQLKRENPNLLIGQYTILSEAYDPKDRRYADKDKGRQLERLDWWLRDENGKRVQWTDRYDSWETNITHWAPMDADSKRYPQWLAERDFGTYFGRFPEFDIWYLDNVLSKPAVTVADWDRDGRNDNANDAHVAQAHREGHVAEWARARQLRPGIILMGNTDDLTSREYSGQLQGAFLEALIGASWSLEKWKGWGVMMRRYHDAMERTTHPRIVGFNVHGSSSDYQLMRYGLASCLLDDGYFSYTDEAKGYSSVPWFDEFDLELGRPLEPAQSKPWKGGVYRRLFERGMVLVNPGRSAVRLRLEAGYRRFLGVQDAVVNSGRAVTELELSGRDGLLLLRD
jgi:hypothetical protein